MYSLFKKNSSETHSDKELVKRELISGYLEAGCIPWSSGYNEYKWDFIEKTINDQSIIRGFMEHRPLSEKFAIGLDERAVEYPWIFSKLSEHKSTILDAGSTLNFNVLVEHPKVKSKALTIYTFFPEANCFFKNKINYVFGDLRKLYFKDETFEEIVSISTIEHIDMDNSIYGYHEESKNGNKSFEYLNAVSEFIRVLKPGGKLLITFPFGKYENHGFFQQFDLEMQDKLLDKFIEIGKIDIDYFKYEKNGWRFAKQSELATVESYNPHTGRGKGTDGAAHCRSITCIEFVKNG